MIEIRPANRDDVSIVEDVVQAGYEPFAAQTGFRPAPLDADYQDLVNAGQVFVTEPRIDGVLVLSPEPGALGIDNIAVHPEAQRRGVGGQLMTYACDQAVRGGFRVVRLYTHSLMTDNIAWYTSLGFVETGREPLPIGERVHMAKDLDA